MAILILFGIVFLIAMNAGPTPSIWERHPDKNLIRLKGSKVWLTPQDLEAL
jgi:hypothetical protein